MVCWARVRNSEGRAGAVASTFVPPNSAMLTHIVEHGNPPTFDCYPIHVFSSRASFQSSLLQQVRMCTRGCLQRAAGGKTGQQEKYIRLGLFEGSSK